MKKNNEIAQIFSVLFFVVPLMLACIWFFCEICMENLEVFLFWIAVLVVIPTALIAGLCKLSKKK